MARRALLLDAQHPRVNLAHTSGFVSIDGAGRIRAFSFGESLDQHEVVRDVKRLAR